MEIEFNVNDWVKVKLNGEGIHELKRQHYELSKVIPNLREFRVPKTDQDGYSKWQLHSLMNTFGHMMILGNEVPFDTVIKIEVGDE